MSMATALGTVAVFCGSNFGSSPVYREAAASLGRALAGRGLALVYGGASKGLMGVMADAALEAGGTVTGSSTGACTNAGTCILTLNVGGFYEPLRALLATACEEGFLKPEHRDMLIIEADVQRLLDGLASWRAPAVTKWIGQPGS